MNNKPNFNYELKYGDKCCGIDEVGRGPLVGPVIASCVHIPKENINFSLWNEVNDSKKLTKKKRSELFNEIKKYSHIGIGISEKEEIEEINILNASLLAMERAYKNMSKTMEHALIDGNKTIKIKCNQTTIIKGDSKSISIAAASIIAKVTRDELITKLSKNYPEYKWEKNSGYGTKEHLEAIDKYGITPHHRKTFSPIKHLIQQK